MGEKNIIKDRISTFLGQINISRAKFCQIVGISPSNFKGPSYNSALSSDKIVSILMHYPSLSAEWLLRGTGDMFLPSSNKHYVIEENRMSVLKQYDTPYETLPQKTKDITSQNDPAVSLALIAHIDTMQDRVTTLQDKIATQAEEIGRLKAENEMLKEECANVMRCEKGATIDGYAVTA